MLNLSENKLDVQGLTAVAEALVAISSHPLPRQKPFPHISHPQKYNTSLETLDISKNPCCGPGLEGVSWVPTKSITIS